METKFTFMVLTFGVLAGTATAFMYPDNVHGLPTIQTKFDNCNRATYPKIEEKEQDISNFYKSLIKQLTTELNAEKVKLKNTEKVAQNNAKAVGKTLDLACVTQARSQIENGLSNSHKKSEKCLEEANKIAKETVAAAKGKYLSVSSKGFKDAKAKEKQGNAASCRTNVQCMTEINSEIQKKLLETLNESQKATEASINASNKQHDDANDCFGTFHSDYGKLHAQHEEDLQKCLG